MKNLNMTINSNAITSLSPPAAYYPGPPSPLVPQEYSVSFSARFETEDEAINFSKVMLEHIQNFKKPIFSIEEYVMQVNNMTGGN